jgi:hypothetical protein
MVGVGVMNEKRDATKAVMIARISDMVVSII